MHDIFSPTLDLLLINSVLNIYYFAWFENLHQYSLNEMFCIKVNSYTYVWMCVKFTILYYKLLLSSIHYCKLLFIFLV